ncbi:MAG: hypothetical protein GY862_32775 [Gammaproteobacteria bacterium]|nr:hypothetical protein [Gammaproteobacteria bacterium]
MNQPQRWEVKVAGQATLIGWLWERKEIENYLLDPVVVKHALGNLAPPNYSQLLDNAANLIACYQAARTALAVFQNTAVQLNTKFGLSRGKSRYLFPNKFDDANCQAGILQNVMNYERQYKEADSNNVLQKYQTFLPDCTDAAGNRRQDFLYAFAGKDLLWALHDPLMKNGVGGGGPAFLEKITKAIENTTDDIATWLPEWQALRKLLESPNLV